MKTIQKKPINISCNNFLSTLSPSLHVQTSLNSTNYSNFIKRRTTFFKLKACVKEIDGFRYRFRNSLIRTSWFCVPITQSYEKIRMYVVHSLHKVCWCNELPIVIAPDRDVLVVVIPRLCQLPWILNCQNKWMVG